MLKYIFSSSYRYKDIEKIINKNEINEKKWIYIYEFIKKYPYHIIDLIFVCCIKDNLYWLKKIINCDLYINCSFTFILSISIYYNSINIAKYLIYERIDEIDFSIDDPHIADGYDPLSTGLTLLHKACYFNRLNMILLIIPYIDINKKSKRVKKTAFEIINDDNTRYVIQKYYKNILENRYKYITSDCISIIVEYIL